LFSSVWQNKSVPARSVSSFFANFHTKLYLLHSDDSFNPIISLLDNSILTRTGLSGLGEKNIDVLEGMIEKSQLSGMMTVGKIGD